MAHHNFIARPWVALIVSLSLPLTMSAETTRPATNQPSSLEVSRMQDEAFEYYKQNNLDKALSLLEQALAASEKSLEPDDPLVIRVLVMRAEQKAANGDSDEAITMLEKALPALDARKASEDYKSAMLAIYYRLGSRWALGRSRLLMVAWHVQASLNKPDFQRGKSRSLLPPLIPKSIIDTARLLTFQRKQRQWPTRRMFRFQSAHLKSHHEYHPTI
jgi:tetratricopeptide (TPR) repeat protein